MLKRLAELRAPCPWLRASVGVRLLCSGRIGREGSVALRWGSEQNFARLLAAEMI